MTEILKRVPGPDASELPKTLADFAADPLSTFVKLRERFGPLFSLPIGDQRTVFLNDSISAEKMLRLDFSTFGMSSRTEELNRPLLGRSMPVVADHRYWQELHSIMQPMFTPKMLRRYFDETVKAVAEEVDSLVAMAEEGREVEMLSFVRHGIFVALTRTLFIRGVEPADIDMLLEWFTQSDRYTNMRYLCGEVADTSDDPEIVLGRQALSKIDSYIYNLIAMRRADPAPQPEDMLDVLLVAKTKDGRELNDVEVRDNVIALFFGGQSTTPSVITWAFGLLSANPEKREKLIKEIDAVLGGRRPTFDDLQTLKYTEMVFDEALRLYPPFSFVAREALEDTELKGYEIPKGTNIGFVGWTIHRNPEDWPEPEKFEPERHTPELDKARNRCAFLSFGYGQRRCAGERVGRMEGMLMLSMISQHLLLDRVGGGISPTRVSMSIQPADGQPMDITKRVFTV